MTDELIDICDESNNLLNIQKMKSVAHKEGLWHRASHVWIYNSQGEILLQLRSKNKNLCPNQWDISAAGHVGSGEEPLESALRETKEELGLFLSEENLDLFIVRKKHAIPGSINLKQFLYVYFFQYGGDIEGLDIQNDEVSQIKFVTLQHLEKDLKDNPTRYVPHGEYWFIIIDEIKRRLNHNS
jgi:isopentenyl-diphosphate Delta-isomerase